MEVILVYIGFDLKKTILLISFLRLIKFGFKSKEKLCYTVGLIVVIYGFGIENVLIVFKIEIFAIIIEMGFLIGVGTSNCLNLLKLEFGE